MPGFRNVREWTEAHESGKSWISSFRKVPAVTNIAGQWFDFSGAAGNPVPNYYASEPLVAATLESHKGIYHGGNVSPAKKVIKDLAIMNGAAGATTTTSQNLTLILCDILLYYPFIDLDAAGEEQILENLIHIPRYVDEPGVMMALIAQASTLGGGRFSVKYTNHEGIANRITPGQFCAAAQPQGAFVQASGSAAGVSPFIPLQDGDSGVASVQSVTMETANGGLGVLVLLKPLYTIYSMEEARRTTTGTLESFGSVAEKQFLSMGGERGEIRDGAFLSFIGLAPAGSISGMQLMGLLEVVWN